LRHSAQPMQFGSSMKATGGSAVFFIPDRSVYIRRACPDMSCQPVFT
jgi:hypothetical protein